MFTLTLKGILSVKFKTMACNGNIIKKLSRKSENHRKIPSKYFEGFLVSLSVLCLIEYEAMIKHLVLFA